MNDQFIITTLETLGYRECADYLKERLTPGGEHPRLVGEHAERADRHGATTSQGQSLRVGQTKVRVELWRLVKHLTEEADKFLDTADFDDPDLDPRIARSSLELAADCAVWGSCLIAILEAEPSPQSEAEVVEESGSLEDWEAAIKAANIDWAKIAEMKPLGGDDVSGACLPNSNIKES